MDSSPDALGPDPSRARTLSHIRFIVLATVLGWNVVAFVVLCAWGAIAVTASTGSENWAGLGILIIVMVMTLAILGSAVLGVIVALVRARKPGRLSSTMSTGQAVLAGTRAAAWGLCAIVSIPVLILMYSQ